MNILIPLLLLLSFASYADDLTTVKGKLRVYLPTVGIIKSVDILLAEQQSSNIITTQVCSLDSQASCDIALPFHLKDINQAKQYAVEIDILYQIGRGDQSYKTSFLVSPLTNPPIMDIVISIPRSPIE